MIALGLAFTWVVEVVCSAVDSPLRRSGLSVLNGDYRGIGRGTSFARRAARFGFVLEPPQVLPVRRDVPLLQPFEGAAADRPGRVDAQVPVHDDAVADRFQPPLRRTDGCSGDGPADPLRAASLGRCQGQVRPPFAPEGVRTESLGDVGWISNDQVVATD